MRITKSKRCHYFGNVRIHETQKVVELDAANDPGNSLTLTVPREKLSLVESQTAIIVLCKNEEAMTLENVFSGIPHDSLIILVSNSSLLPHNRYNAEVGVLQNLCSMANRRAIAVHQKDPGAAKAFRAAGAPGLVGADGLIRNGKGEGMLMGMTLAALEGCQYIGFLDADNYASGAVLEYCKAYAAVLQMAEAENAMVRISWGSKPKVRDGRLVYDLEGRSSQRVNRFMNELLQGDSASRVECMETGNAGEHAMTMALAKKLQIAGGFAVEPCEIVYLMEQMGNNPSRALGKVEIYQIEPKNPEMHDDGVDIYQIKTRNPHIHDNKGDEHVGGMCAEGLSAIYNSSIAGDRVKNAVRGFMESEGLLAKGDIPAKPRFYPAIETLDLGSLRKTLNKEAKTLRKV